MYEIFKIVNGRLVQLVVSDDDANKQEEQPEQVVQEEPVK